MSAAAQAGVAPRERLTRRRSVVPSDSTASVIDSLSLLTSISTNQNLDQQAYPRLVPALPHNSDTLDQALTAADMTIKPSRVVQTTPLLCGSRPNSGSQEGAVAKPAAVLALRGEPKSDSRQGEASGQSLASRRALVGSVGLTRS